MLFENLFRFFSKHFRVIEASSVNENRVVKDWLALTKSVRCVLQEQILVKGSLCSFVHSVIDFFKALAVLNLMTVAFNRSAVSVAVPFELLFLNGLACDSVISSCLVYCTVVIKHTLMVGSCFLPRFILES